MQKGMIQSNDVNKFRMVAQERKHFSYLRKVKGFFLSIYHRLLIIYRTKHSLECIVFEIRDQNPQFQNVVFPVWQLQWNQSQGKLSMLSPGGDDHPIGIKANKNPIDYINDRTLLPLLTLFQIIALDYPGQVIRPTICNRCSSHE